jgi:hypothetical protein
MIPKIIHLCWFSGDPYPELIRKCLESWRQFLPDYEIKLWDAAQLAKVEMPEWVSQAITAKKYAFAADYVRLYALYTYGGFYLDSDVQVLHSFDDLLGNLSVMGKETSGDFEPAVIGAVPRTEWLGKCMEYYHGRSFVKNDGSYDMTPLPIIVGETLQREYGIPQRNARAALYPEAELRIFEAVKFSPKCRITKEILAGADTYAVHHFDGKWVESTFVHQMKEFVHKTVVNLFGRSFHNKFVNLIRKARR